MPKYEDVVDLYDDCGKRIAKDIPLEAISPLRNNAIKKIVSLTKRTCAVNLAGIEKALKTGSMTGGGVVIQGKEIDIPLVENADKIAQIIKENVQVYVNERIVRESGEELIKYLYSIRAEDIVRIEVIPVGGVEHEASAQGGIIKLTLRKQRDDGLEGSLRMRYGTRLNDNPQQYIQPSLSINYRLAKFSLYTDITENRNKYYGYGIARRINKNGYSFESNWRQSSLKDSPTLRVGTIYDISPRHSVGVEANLAGYFPEKERSSVVDTVFYNGALQGTIESDYNYLNKHKIPGDAYTYRSNNESQNDLYSVTGDFDIRAGDNARVKTGFKYIFSQVDSWMKYEDLVGDIWVVRPDQTYDMVYDEHISAAYGRWVSDYGSNTHMPCPLLQVSTISSGRTILAFSRKRI